MQNTFSLIGEHSNFMKYTLNKLDYIIQINCMQKKIRNPLTKNYN